MEFQFFEVVVLPVSGVAFKKSIKSNSKKQAVIDVLQMATCPENILYVNVIHRYNQFPSEQLKSPKHR